MTMPLAGPPQRSHADKGDPSASKLHSGTSCALASPFASPCLKKSNGDPALAISAAEATPQHVFAHIEVLESHANEELWEGVCYASLPLPFGKPFDSHKAEEFFPTICEALGMRDHAKDESKEDAALAACHATQWYYFAIRCTEPGQHHQKLAVIKARSPVPCLALIIKMLSLGAEVSQISHGATFAPIVLLGASIDSRNDDLHEGAAIARRLWHAGLSRGGTVLREPDHAADGAPQGLQGFTWMRMPDEAAMDGLWMATFLHPSSRHLALMRTLRTAARIAAPLLSLHREAIERSYAPSGAGYKRAREEFESHRVC
jgi:hypothetical protein